VRGNIQVVLHLDEEQDRERSMSGRLGASAGTVTFVVLHLL